MPEPVTTITIALLSGVVANVVRDLIDKYLHAKKSRDLKLTVKGADGTERVIDFNPTDEQSIKKVLTALGESDATSDESTQGK